MINRKRDFERAQYEHWYRVPYQKAPKGIYAEYVAFFFSRAFKEQNGGIYYYARRTGMELARRRDLLPEEADHPRAESWYHKLQLGELRHKDPPILNPTRRRVAFIYTTWDRFVAAQALADLYSEADQFVDRVFHALEQTGVHAERVWEASRSGATGGAELRIDCEDGTVIASTAGPAEHVVPLHVADTAAAVHAGVETILAAIRAHGGPLMVNVPLEG